MYSGLLALKVLVLHPFYNTAKWMCPISFFHILQKMLKVVSVSQSQIKTKNTVEVILKQALLQNTQLLKRKSLPLTNNGTVH